MQNGNIVKNEDFNNFLKGFKCAVKKVDEKHISIESAGWDLPKYAERTYCYELYHQMRNSFGDRYEYTINAELPKVTHEIIQVNRSPDFLVHLAGSMDSNLVILEVKPFSVARTFSSIDEDLCKLDFFTGKTAKYHRGIMHVFGVSVDETEKANLIHYFKDYSENLTNQEKIVLSLHTDPGEEPIIVTATH